MEMYMGVFEKRGKSKKWLYWKHEIKWNDNSVTKECGIKGIIIKSHLTIIAK